MVGFPLLLIPLAIYNIIAFLMRDVSFVAPLITLPLPSGTAWPVTLSDILLTLGVLLLLLEVVKGARPGAKYLTDHLLSLVVLCGAGAEFALLPPFGTSTYFLLTALALADFFSGIALRVRRPAHVTAAHVTAAPAASRRGVPPPDLNPPEPTFDHTPAPAAPAAELVQPKITHADVAPIEPVSPEVPSPGLQPGSGTPSPDAPPR